MGQVGTVIESSTEFYSGRLTKKERKATLADELLSDETLKNYRSVLCSRLVAFPMSAIPLDINRQPEWRFNCEHGQKSA